MATTVFVAVSITDTVPAWLATYTKAPSRVTATPAERLSTGTVATTALADVSITNTASASKSAT